MSVICKPFKNQLHIFPGKQSVYSLVRGSRTVHEWVFQRLLTRPSAKVKTMETTCHHEQEYDASGRHQRILGLLSPQRIKSQTQRLFQIWRCQLYCRQRLKRRQKMFVPGWIRLVLKSFVKVLVIFWYMTRLRDLHRVE